MPTIVEPTILQNRPINDEPIYSGESEKTSPPSRREPQADGAIIVPRGCGDARISGAVYAECGISLGGTSTLRDFICDPPFPIDAALRAMISPNGVTLFQQPGTDIWHIIDWIGESFYPNVWDFLGEVARFGLSRRLSSLLEYDKISPESRLLAIHRKAIIRNDNDYPDWNCPRDLISHEKNLGVYPCCAGVWAQDIVDGEPVATNTPIKTVTLVDGKTAEIGEPRLIRRVRPAFTYYAHSQPPYAEPEYDAGFIASFPLSRLAIVNGGENPDRVSQSVSRANRVPIVHVDR